MNRSVPLLLTILLIISLQCTRSGTIGSDLETISPEEAGWSSEKLDEAAKYAGEIGYTALVLMHDGKAMYSWGEVTKNYKCHSIRKPFLSALYGIYVENGEIDIDLTVGELGIDDIPPKLTEAEKQATIRHLLMGRSGIYHPAAAETESMAAARPQRGSHPHGRRLDAAAARRRRKVVHDDTGRANNRRGV
jgi:CubicO group peptidase (beta-lactamase class C family)